MSLDGVEDLYELTPLQLGMLFNGLLAPDSDAYTIVVDLGVEGALQPAAVQAAWDAVLARHAALRTSFLWERMERPVQVVHRTVQSPVAWHDWQALDGATQAAQREAFVAADKRQGFDLRRAPLVRLAVLALGGGRQRLVFTFHHIVLEGWSMGIVLADLRSALEATLAGRAPTLPPAQPYAEYLHWHRRQDRATAEQHWRAALAGVPAATRLPYDRSSADGPVPVAQVAQQTLRLSPEAHAALAAFARAQRVTLNTVLHGAFALLLARSAGDDDALFGTVTSGRPADLEGAEAIVGLFVATLPVRARCAAGEPLMPWLRRLQLELATMREHAHASLVDVQSWSSVPAGRPLFHAVLAFENWLDAALPPAGDLRFTERVVHETSDQPLTLFVTFDPTLTLTLMYDVARFERAPVERMLGHLQALLASMVAATPETTLGELRWLTPAEEHELVVVRNQTATTYPRDAGIAALFVEQARQRPDAVALEHQGATLSYAQLDAASDRVAAALHAAGVGHETRVALLAERSLELVVAMLGILKAGGAYVPLDPAYPPARLATMLADAAPPVLLAAAAKVERLPPFEGRVITLEAATTSDALAAPPCPAGGSSLAYVMYTSGSTGVPKGACIEQRSVVRLVRDTRFIELGPDETFLLFAPVAFDASTLEIWGALLNGARLVIAPPGPLSLAELGALIRDARISVLWLTSALFNQMVAEQLPSLAGVRQLLAGGEAVSVPHAMRLLDAMPPEGRLINGYGPTENTTFTCTHAMAPGVPLGASVPIGRPISNTRVIVADAARRPVPVGVWGELLIGGDGLARGYLNQPELTARAFVDDPFVPGARLYRSGDRVRWTEDGVIEFGGRIDRQLKLRGHRIEPGEIEAALKRHPQVHDAVVAVLGEQAELRRLVAWVAVPEGPALAAAALREHLAALLPPPMVPQAFVVLPVLPLNANGKVDRAALPLPEAGPAPEVAMPRTAREQRIAACWAEALGVPRVGLDDNFFDLGGNSLLVMRLHVRLQAAGEAALKVVDLFQHPTVRTLAAHLAGADAAPAAAAAAATTAADTLGDRARKRREALRRTER